MFSKAYVPVRILYTVRCIFLFLATLFSTSELDPSFSPSSADKGCLDIYRHRRIQRENLYSPTCKLSCRRGGEKTRGRFFCRSKEKNAKARCVCARVCFLSRRWKMESFCIPPRGKGKERETGQHPFPAKNWKFFLKEGGKISRADIKGGKMSGATGFPFHILLTEWVTRGVRRRRGGGY